MRIFKRTSKPALQRAFQPLAFKPLALLLVLAGLSQARPAQAEIVGYNVRLDTTSLANSDRGGSGQDIFRLDYYFTDNSTNPATSSVTLGDFNFSNGSGTPATPSSFSDTELTFDGNSNPIPSASGTLTTPGDFLSFNLTFNYSVDSPYPDVFSFGLYNLSDGPEGNYVFNDDLDDPISLFKVTFASGGPVIQTYGSSEYSLAAPTVTATPEPQTWTMMFIGLGAVLFVIARNRKQKALQVPVVAQPEPLHVR